MMVSKAANGETLNGIPHGDPVASECLSNYKKKEVIQCTMDIRV